MLKNLILSFSTAFVVAAAPSPVNFDLTVTCEKTVREETADAAASFRMPESSTAVTECGITVGPSENLAGGYRVTFNTFSQNSYIGETTFADEENLGAVIPGRWVEFTLSGLAAGELTRDPGFTLDSEYLDYGFIAFLLIESAGAAAGGNERIFSVVEQNLPNGNSSGSVVRFRREEADIGEKFTITYERELSQDTKLSKMVGSAALFGLVRKVNGDDGLAVYARAELEGNSERTFTIVGKDTPLKEEIKLTIDVLREDAEGPAEWGE